MPDLTGIRRQTVDADIPAMVTGTAERRVYRILIRIIFVAVTASSLIALFGEQFWVAELFTHFRLYYLLVLALMALIFLHSGHLVLMALAVLFAISNLWVVGPYLMPVIAGKSAAADVDTGVDIVALNVNYRNDKFARVVDYLRKRDPDIIVLSELTPAWRDRLEFLRESHPYQLGKLRSDPWGLAVFSRLSLAQAELIELAETDAVHARFTLVIGTKTLEVFAVHLFSPTSFVRARDRNLQLEDLADRILASEHQSIVIGDMNLTPFSPYFSRFTRRSGLQDARRIDGLEVTWPVSVLPIWIPIDHALVDPEVNAVRVRAGPDVGSDHFPLEIIVLETAEDLRRD